MGTPEVGAHSIEERLRALENATLRGEPHQLVDADILYEASAATVHEPALLIPVEKESPSFQIQFGAEGGIDWTFESSVAEFSGALFELPERFQFTEAEAGESSLPGAIHTVIADEAQQATAVVQMALTAYASDTGDESANQVHGYINPDDLDNFGIFHIRMLRQTILWSVPALT